MNNKIVLITGATDGIGKVTATELAKKGFQVVFVARNTQKAEKVKKEIIAASGNKNIDFITANLNSLKQIKVLAETFKKQYPKLDVLINNTGIMASKRELTEDGFESTFHVNHLAPFLLTLLLVDELKKSDEGRIVNVGSGMHERGILDYDNLQSEKKFSTTGTYASSKVLNMLFTLELADRLKGTGITVNTLHPGLVKTNYSQDLQLGLKIMFRLFSPLMITPEKGAETSIYLASSPEVKNVTGKYFDKCKPIESKNKFITNENKKLAWKKTLSLLNMNDSILN